MFQWMLLLLVKSVLRSSWECMQSPLHWSSWHRQARRGWHSFLSKSFSSFCIHISYKAAMSMKRKGRKIVLKWFVCSLYCKRGCSHIDYSLFACLLTVKPSGHSHTISPLCERQEPPLLQGFGSQFLPCHIKNINTILLITL